MSCYHPRPQYECVDVLTGEVGFFLWNVPRGYRAIKKQFVSCRQCIGCRDGYSRYWGIRCSHEAQYHKENSFLTLTVDDKNLEKVFPGRSLRYEPFQLFIRAFRKKLGFPIRFFMCGEYGEDLGRPHYHSIVFGWYPDTNDRIFYKETSVGTLYVSRVVSKLWPFGYHTVGSFSVASAQYVAGYITKKINGKLAPKWYGKLHPEFSHCSNGGGAKKHGIGGQYYIDYKHDIYNAKDSITLPGGSQVPPGTYYDKLHKLYHPSHMERLKEIRSLPDPVRDFLSSPSQLKAREVVHRSRRKPGRNNFGGV